MEEMLVTTVSDLQDVIMYKGTGQSPVSIGSISILTWTLYIPYAIVKKEHLGQLYLTPSWAFIVNLVYDFTSFTPSHPSHPSHPFTPSHSPRGLPLMALQRFSSHSPQLGH